MVKGNKIVTTENNFLTMEEDIHAAINQKGETKTYKKVQETYANIPMTVVKKVISKCVRCAEKAKKKSIRNVIVRPITVSELNDRGQVDLIDYRTLKTDEHEYLWLLHYQEHLTKFSYLRALMHKRPALVAQELLLIFLMAGAPRVLQAIR